MSSSGAGRGNRSVQTTPAVVIVGDVAESVGPPGLVVQLSAVIPQGPFAKIEAVGSKR